MKQAELIDEVARRLQMPKAKVKRVVLDTLAVITKSMVNKDKVTLPGFGTFTTVERAARVGRNPQNGESVQIQAKTAPKFTPGTTLKRSVNNK